MVVPYRALILYIIIFLMIDDKLSTSWNIILKDPGKILIGVAVVAIRGSTVPPLMDTLKK